MNRLQSGARFSTARNQVTPTLTTPNASGSLVLDTSVPEREDVPGHSIHEVAGTQPPPVIVAPPESEAVPGTGERVFKNKLINFIYKKQVKIGSEATSPRMSKEAARRLGLKREGEDTFAERFMEKLPRPKAKQPGPEEENPLTLIASIRDVAAILMHAVELHQHQAEKNGSFLKEDQFVLNKRVSSLADKHQAVQHAITHIQEPTGFAARVKASADAQRQEKTAEADRLEAERTHTEGLLRATDARVGRADTAIGFIGPSLKDITKLYHGARGLTTEVKKAGVPSDHQRTLIRDRVPEISRAQVTEEASAEQRNITTRDVNDVRYEGRGERLLMGIAKTIAASGTSSGLSLATANFLSVEKKTRGGGYSSTLRVLTFKERINRERAALTRLENSSEIYGTQHAAKGYSVLKGLSRLFVVPVRDFLGWLTTIFSVLGSILTAATVGTAAPVIVPITTGLGYAGLSLTALNALINSALLTWNLVREKLLDDEAFRAMLRGETGATGVAALSEGLSAVASGAGIGIKAASIVNTDPLNASTGRDMYAGAGIGNDAASIVNGGNKARDLYLTTGILGAGAELASWSKASYGVTGAAKAASVGAGLAVGEASPLYSMETERQESPALRQAPQESHGTKLQRRWVAWRKSRKLSIDTNLGTLTESAGQQSAAIAQKFESAGGGIHKVKKFVMTLKAMLSRTPTEQGQPSAAENAETAGAAGLYLEAAAENADNAVRQVTTSQQALESEPHKEKAMSSASL